LKFEFGYFLEDPAFPRFLGGDFLEEVIVKTEDAGGAFVLPVLFICGWVGGWVVRKFLQIKIKQKEKAKRNE